MKSDKDGRKEDQRNKKEEAETGEPSPHIWAGRGRERGAGEGRSGSESGFSRKYFPEVLFLLWRDHRTSREGELINA